MTRCTVSGEEPANPATAPVPNDAKRADGQHVDHWTMCPGEIIQSGFKRPVRLSYTHVGIAGPKYLLRDLTDEERKTYGDRYAKYEMYPDSESPKLGRFWTQSDLDKVGKGCGTSTRMPQQIAETYAANPGYYGNTFCCGCNQYLAVGKDGEFVWEHTNDRVGT